MSPCEPSKGESYRPEGEAAHLYRALRACGNVIQVSETMCQLMDSIVDIYMPDFKYWDPEMARKYSKVAD